MSGKSLQNTTRFPCFPSDVVHEKKTPNDHNPTNKPVKLMKKIIGWTDGRVLDAFMGSGSTLLAAAELGREAIGIELEAIGFDTACRRVEEAYWKAGRAVERIKENSKAPVIARSPQFALF